MSCSISGVSVNLQEFCKFMGPLMIQAEVEVSTLGRHNMRRSVLGVKNQQGLFVSAGATAPAYSAERSRGTPGSEHLFHYYSGLVKLPPRD